MALGALLVAAGGAANAQNFEVPITPDIDNLVGGAVGLVPDYEGSDDYEIAGGPLLSFKFWGERYFQVIGNKAFLNVLDSPNYEAGLKGVYRRGRDDDVDDNAVSRLDEVDDSFELGGFVGYRRKFNNDARHRVNVHLDITQDITDGHDGFVVDLVGTYWRPIFKPFDIGINGGLSYASSNYMSSFFDVSTVEAARTGLSRFDADSGFKDARISLMGLFHFSESWHAGAGFQYKRLFSDAADSPIVDDRGDANQLFGGIAVLYTW